MPSYAKEFGLLSLHYFESLKDFYGKNETQKKLLSAIVKLSPAIQIEFEKILNSEILINSTDRKHYVNNFCNMIFIEIESAFICKHNPDSVIKTAFNEWLVEGKKENEPFHPFETKKLM